jgi:hypothetical protein
MSHGRTHFYGKTWIYRAQAIVFGSFTIFGLCTGPLFLTGTWERADGKPGTGAGIGLTAVTLVFMLPVFVLAVFNLRVRRQPIVRLCREGIEARLIGGTRVDGVPLLPTQVRLLWGFLSTEFFRVRVFRVLWPDVVGAQVTGLPGMRLLCVHGAFREISDGTALVTQPVANDLTIQQVYLKRPLEELATAISHYRSSDSIRGELGSWSQS